MDFSSTDFRPVGVQSTHTLSAASRATGNRVTRLQTLLSWQLRLVQAVAVAIFVCIIGIGALAATGRIAPSGTDAEFFGHPLLVVMSGSMAPTIPVGSLVVMNPVSAQRAAELKVGDIVTFRPASGTAGALVTHRVVSVRRGAGGIEYVTKGDANASPDITPLVPARVVGAYSRHYAVLGMLIRGFTRWQVIALVAISLLLAHVGLEQRSDRGTVKRKKQQI